MNKPNRRLGVALAAGIAVLAITIPVLAASPSPSITPTGSPTPAASASPAATAAPSPASTAPAATTKPAATAKPAPTAKPAAPPKPDKGDETTVTLRGTVQTTVDGDGHRSYTMTVAGKTWTLSAGPPWFWGDKNPLAAYVGTSVTVAGTTRAGASEVDVETVDGTALRAPGKPPWAGGPWVVGPAHPGWKDWMANGKPGNGQGKANAPGQVKKESASS
jgi:hypothetical protein